MRKVITAGLVAMFALSLTACSSSGQATPVATASARVWSEAERGYLTEIYASNMAANDVFPEDVYVDMGNTVCQGLTQGKETEALLALLSATAEKNGLPINDRQVFGPTVMAAAVAYLCPDNLNTLVE